jgi:asparagine synthase (glutamine-hydrolysing)
MSGIVGIVNLDGSPVDRDLLFRMTDFLSLRGPDASEVWSEGNVGFGHTMLRAVSEAETEHQPLSLDGKVWIVADARIDGSSHTLNDPERILHAYQTFSEDCVNHLIGDFAFAIWDFRTQTLFCGRDHFGVKPFFFARIANSFVFSNTLNALRLDERITDHLNEVAIGDYLLTGLNQDPSTTVFRDIQRLPAGHTLRVSRGSVKTRCYWTPTISKQIRFKDNRSYVERFTELLSQAVKDRLRTNQVAISMSGGLDSTSVATIARDLLPGGKLQACSVVYDKLIPDQERYYSEAAAQHLGIPITHITADQFSLFDEAGDMDQAEPFLLSPLTGQFSDLLRRCAGIGRIALTGYDGDAFMAEHPPYYFAALARKMKIRHLFTDLIGYVCTQRGMPPIGLRTWLMRMITGRQEVSIFYPKWIDEEFARRINLRERCNEIYGAPRLQATESETSFDLRPSLLRALNSKVWASLFEGFDPGATKLALEFRHPFIDLRLVEYLFSIPAVPWCINKHILRVAMKDRLPAAVVQRPKTPLAGDPALELSRDASVRCLDKLDANPQLKAFVDISCLRSIAEELTTDGLWANLRVLALNRWLTNSRSMDRRRAESKINQKRAYQISIA